MNCKRKNRNERSIKGIASLLLGAASVAAGGLVVAAGAGCEHHERRVRRVEPVPVTPAEEVVVVRDDRGFDHRGFYDRDGAWHGGYYDERHVFHDDERDWGRAHDKDWERHRQAQAELEHRDHEGR